MKSAQIIASAEVQGEAEEVRFEIVQAEQVVGVEVVQVEHDTAQACFESKNPKLWYPRRYGKQPLYVLTATLVSGHVVHDAVSKTFGLRRAKVVQQKLYDAPGTSFMFEINNIPIFCGGSNWIPAHIWTTKLKRNDYFEWVRLAADGNQFMLRAWGGGIFEQQAFYDACDELGILVWQDFLFACGNYPAHRDFLKLVKDEAVANVRNLRHHPSIVVWAGNNEDYQYQETEKLGYDLEDKDPESWLRSKWPARYIYEKILVDVTQKLVPGTYYHYGSPFGGNVSSDPTVGDIHQWNVWHGTQEKYQQLDKLSGRLVTEFGIEGFPDMRTVDYYLPQGTKDVDRYPQSSTVDFHNKAVGHERRLALYLTENIQFKFEPFVYYVYCTQLVQAECIGTALRLWKRQWKGPGREYCSGALVWQMNDCWPCQSWSIVDHFLRPKLAYNALKREMAPLTLGMKRTIEIIPADSDTHAYTKTIYKIQLWACNLDLEPHRPGISIQTFNLDSSQSYEHTELSCLPELLANRSTEIMEFEVPVRKKGEGEELQTVVAASLLGADNCPIKYFVNWPEPLKYCHLPKAKKIFCNLNPIVESIARSALHPALEAGMLSISSEVPLKGVRLEVKQQENKNAPLSDVIFDENGFDLMDRAPVLVKVWGLEQGRLRITYLGCEGDPIVPIFIPNEHSTWHVGQSQQQSHA